MTAADDRSALPCQAAGRPPRSVSPLAAGLVASLLSAALVLAGGSPAAAQMGAPIAVWNMDGPGSVLVDSSGSGLHGTVGAAVGTEAVAGGAVGYQFTGGGDVNRARLVEVPEDPRLDPGTRDFSVTVRLMTTQATGNIVQKGQARSAGGYFKMETTNGRAFCVFRGSGGTVAVGSGVRVDDGAWHTITCQRVGNTAAMYVDWQLATRRTGSSGRIDNADPLTIGGKPYCNQGSVDCDYFAGVLDVVRLDDLGAVPPPPAPQPPPAAPAPAPAPVVK